MRPLLDHHGKREDVARLAERARRPENALRIAEAIHDGDVHIACVDIVWLGFGELDALVEVRVYPLETFIGVLERVAELPRLLARLRTTMRQPRPDVIVVASDQQTGAQCAFVVGPKPDAKVSA